MEYKFVNSILNTMDKMYLRMYEGKYVDEMFKVQYLSYDEDTKRVRFQVIPNPANTDYLRDYQKIEIDISELSFEKVMDTTGLRINGLRKNGIRRIKRFTEWGKELHQ